MNRPEITDHLPPAGLLRHLAAMFYDFMIVFAIEWLLIAAFAALESFVLDDQGKQLPDILKLVTMILAGYWYFVGSWTVNGKTIGMQAWRMEVRGFDGSPITSARGWLRAVTSVLGLGHLSKLVDPAKLGWHERLSKTVTVVDRDRVLKPGQTPDWNDNLEA
ncbi:MAG: RDD family protein [Pseudomonadota bacterium]